jgi:hypothetical protein
MSALPSPVPGGSETLTRPRALAPSRNGSPPLRPIRWIGSGLLLTTPWLGWALGERWSRRADVGPAPFGRSHDTPPPTDQASFDTASGQVPITRGLPVIRLPGSPDPRDILAVRAGSGLAASTLTTATIPAQGRFSLGGGGRAEEPGQQPEAGIDQPAPWLITALSGAAGLGGEINLDNLTEKAMPAAARAEQLRWQRSGDPLAALPRHWRDALRLEVGTGSQQVQAEVVRLPAPHLQKAEEVPLAIRSNGQAQSLVPPPSAQSQKLVETWASRQAPLQEGAVRAVVVTLEPISLTPSPAPATTAPAPLAEPAPAGPESAPAQASPPATPSP